MNRLLFLFLFIYLSSIGIIFSQENRTKLTSISIQSKEVSLEEWNNLIIKQKEIITFYFTVAQNKIASDEILFRIFLNGKLVNLEDPHGKSISFSNLEEGNYILKIQGYAEDGWESIPVVTQFTVNNSQSTASQSIVEKKLDSYKQILTYAVIIFATIIFFSTVILSIKKISKRKRMPSKKDDESKFDFSERQNNNTNRQDSHLIEKVRNLVEANTRLKTEFKKLDDHKDFLKEQIKELKSYVINLENSNAQLIDQKDKLTESKRRLEELQEQKEKLFAIAVHDIKNPASAIKGYVELLEGYDLNAVEQQEIMQYLASTSVRIVQLAQQMSVVIGKKEPEPELILVKSSIKTVIDNVCNQNTAYAKRKNIKLVNNASQHCPELSFDIEKIYEVIDNLVNNAIKFSKPNAVVQVRSYFNDKKVFVEVVDNGIGLPEDDIPKLFTKGAKLSAKPTHGEESSGLGLWIVKNIIEDHGGSVWAKSKLGIGSSFTFELPIKK
ncbi:MAG: HAMP domain-containing sensor histidine kinase [Ignavibacteriales bacterium]|nr:HAMP domain-containing sensor histidine kinase [Ignavibacteriales bacterium]